MEIEDEVLVIDEEPEALEETFVTNEDVGNELGNDDFLLEDAIHQPEGEVMEERPDVSHDDPPKLNAAGFVLKPVVKDHRRHVYVKPLQKAVKSRENP